MSDPFRYFNRPEVIRLVVMMYVRYPLSLRSVEDLLAERGIDISHETVRFWWNRFGPMFAAEIRKRRVAQSQALIPSIHHRNRPHYPVFDQTGELVNPAVAPTQMLSATVAEAQGPRASRKPRVFERRLARLTAPYRLRESDYIKSDTLRIREHKLIPPVIRETVPLLRYMIKTPRAQPVASLAAGCKLRAVRNFHVAHLHSRIPDSWLS